MKITKLILLFGLFFSISCSKSNTFTDIRDDKTYKIVKIGNQWWMAENLAITNLKNEIVLPLIIEDNEWIGLKTPAYSWYNNDEKKYGKIYGALYNWYAIDSCNLCPNGWRIPTDNDWKVLEQNLGLSKIDVDLKGIRGIYEGGKLKAINYWKKPNVNSTNESGFTGLPEGHRNWKTGKFIDEGVFGTWWSKTEENSQYAWRRTIHHNDSKIRRFTSHKRDGFSVRCVKN